MTKSLLRMFLPVVAVVLAAAQPAGAQFGSQGQMGAGSGFNGGSTGFGGMGQTSGNGSFGPRTLGASSMGGPQRTAMGSGMGSSAFGGMSQGNGMGQGFGMENQGNVGQMTGNEWYVPGNRRAGQFVGADSGDTRNFIGAFSQLAGMAGQARNGGFGANNQFGQNRQNGNRQQQGNRQNQGRNGRGREDRSPMLRTYTAGFSFASEATSAPSVGQRLSAQLSKSRSVNAIGPVQVRMEGRTAVLRGVVASEQDRALAAQMAMLEPGVSQVKNELLVGPDETDPGSPALELPPPSRPAR